MKKTIALFLVFTLALAFAACGKSNNNDPTDPANPSGKGEAVTDINGNVLPDNLPEGALTSMKETFDTMEYTMYINVFQDTSTKQFDGVEFNKVGTFARLQDEWSGKTRYYVWGYNDATRCCDYQWEFVPQDESSLPPVGSYIRVKGVFTYTEDQKTGALDHYWITDASVETLEEYTPAAYDYDLTTMSATLARVQLFSIQNYADKFNGKTMLIYGRAFSPNTLQHPYYDETWYLDFTTADNKVPATGQYLLLGGKIVAEGESCKLEVTAYHEV